MAEEYNLSDYLQGKATQGAGSNAEAHQISYIYRFRDRARYLSVDGAADHDMSDTVVGGASDGNASAVNMDGTAAFANLNSDDNGNDGLKKDEATSAAISPNHPDLLALVDSDSDVGATQGSEGTGIKTLNAIDTGLEEDEERISDVGENKDMQSKVSVTAINLLASHLHLYLQALELANISPELDEKKMLLAKVAEVLDIRPSRASTPAPSPEFLAARESLDEQAAVATAAQMDLHDLRDRHQSVVQKTMHILYDRGDVNPSCRYCRFLRDTVSRALTETDDE